MRFVGYTTVDQPLIAKILHDKDLAIQDLKNHFYTRIGERVMDPEFGSIIPLMIFEPLDDISVQEIEADVRRIIGLDPRWELNDLAVIENEHEVTLQLKLIYLDKTEEEVLLAYERDIV
tara:strand:- start:907 stop:1263 length:357 start_codon:yes stop_codon:yes gene_type:complete